ncbi:helix-turn-helix domain-containing protein [Desulfuromonas sp. KJ2020]|nr:helix-turn-helix domain-containing protein [Desulfuromonas sp. KJ2020]
MTQADLGDLLGIEKAAVSKYEKGGAKRGVPIESLQKIACACKVTLDWLITGKEPDRPKEPSREAALVELAKAAYQGDKAFAQSICEAAGLYSSNSSLSKEEMLLVENYRAASQKIRRAAFNMLEDDAQESRGNGGGGSDLAEQNSA